MKLYPNVPCCICQEYVDPASAYWITTEGACFDNEGWPRVPITDLMPTCEECVIRVLSDRDPPRHALRRPRPPDSK